MNGIIRFLENDLRRYLVWSALIITVHGIKTVILNQPWQLRQTLSAIFFVFMAEIIFGILAKNRKR